MKAVKPFGRAFAALALICGLSLPVHAQIGTGWSPGGESIQSQQTSAGCTIMPIPGGFSFHVPSGLGRAENQWSGADLTSTWQWTGTCKIVSWPFGSNNTGIYQLYGYPVGDVIIDMQTGGGTTTNLVSRHDGAKVVGNIPVGVPFNFAAIYDPGTALEYIYINGSQTGTTKLIDSVSGGHFDKNGSYVAPSGSGPATVEWTNTSNWKGGIPFGSGFTIKFNLPSSAVTASAFQSPNAPANTVDGNPATRWSAQGDPQWIQYDLGSANTVDFVKAAIYNGNTRMQTFDIQTSTDGATFATVASGLTSSGTTAEFETFNLPSPVSARFVRLLCHGNSVNTWNSFTEVEIWGSANILAKVADPQFNPPVGTYPGEKMVTLSSSTGGASIRYTTDGVTTPSATVGTLYTPGAAIPVAATTTLMAIAYENGLVDSNITRALYTIRPTLPPPFFTPPASVYFGPQSVTIRDLSLAAYTLYYTTDGSMPTASSTPYRGSPVSISTSTTLRAIAIAPSGASSAVTTGLYTIGDPIPFTITASADSGGLINPAGAVVVGQGASQTFTIIPIPDARILDVTVDDKSVGPVGSYTFTDVQADHTIKATFTGNLPIAKFTITSSAGLGGSITPPGASVVVIGGGQCFTITPGAGNQILDVLVDGMSVGPVASYCFTDVQANHTISATFAAPNRTLTGSSGDGWHTLAISPAATGTFTATFDATPAVSPENAVIGLSNGAATSYSDCSCIVRFNPSGQIDVRNGGTYQAVAVIPYAAGAVYRFRMVVNVPAHTYSVYLDPPPGSLAPTRIVARDFAFRTEQNTVTSLDHWDLDVNATPSGCSLTAVSLNP